MKQNHVWPSKLPCWHAPACITSPALQQCRQLQAVLHLLTDFLPVSGDCLALLRPHFLLYLAPARATASGIMHRSRMAWIGHGVLKI